jgi:hypothetical protein
LGGVATDTGTRQQICVTGRTNEFCVVFGSTQFTEEIPILIQRQRASHSQGPRVSALTAIATKIVVSYFIPKILGGLEASE